MMPSRRTILAATILLLAGALVSIVVAAVCLKLDLPSLTQPRARRATDQWLIQTPADWPQAEDIDSFRRFGSRSRMQVVKVRQPPPGPGTYHVYVSEIGWPFYCLRSAEWSQFTAFDGYWLTEPIRQSERIGPSFPGFLLNTIFYAAILALPLSFFPIRRRLRARRGRCPKCGYDLAGLADLAAPCPECGAAR